MNSRYSLFIIIIILLGLSGCSYVERPNDPRFAPVIPQSRTEIEPVNGSVFHAHAGLSLYEDIKAHQVGDIITVIFDEVMNATKGNKNTIGKTNDTTISNPTVLGTLPGFGLSKALPIPLQTTDNLTLQAAINSSVNFEGNADTSQNNNLTGTVSVTVSKILANGNLEVRGEKWINLNTGDEYIRLSGIIRARDISPENTIASSRIADARISYSGSGSPASASEPGWLVKLFTSGFWPI